MRNLVLIFSILGILLLCGSGCAMRLGDSPRGHQHYNNRTARHYGAKHQPRMRSMYWGRHRYGHRGHSSRGRYR